MYLYGLNSSISDFTFYGDVYVASITINENQNINIYGDITNGSVNVNGGSLYVSGNSYNTSYSSSFSNSRILIDNNAVLSVGKITAGEMEIKGDITASYNVSINKLILSGDERQDITNANNITLDTLELRYMMGI